LDLTSKTLTEYRFGDLPQRFSIHFQGGLQNFYNLNSNGSRLDPIRNTFISLGVENRSPAMNETVSVYSRLGATHVYLDGNAFSRPNTTGGYVTFGMDVAFQQLIQHPAGRATSSFFTALTGNFGFPRSDRLSGEIDLLNGLWFSLGFRNHF
jgi:hypothetical protein